MSKEMSARERAAGDDGFNSAICYVLGYLNGTGDCGSTAYEEILTGAGEEQVIAYARRNHEMRFTGLATYVRRSKQP
jgi:hypothetical protein